MLRHLPVRRRLTILMSLVGVVVLILAMSAVFILEIYSYRTSMAKRLEAMLEGVTPQIQKGLVLGRKDFVAKVLDAFGGDRQVRAVFILRQGAVFASYLRSGGAPHDLETGLPYGNCTLLDQLSTLEQPSSHFTATHFALARPIRYQNRIVGHIYLQSGLNELNDRLSQYLGLLVALLAVCALVSYLLSRRLQGMVTGPIHRLHQAMEEVSEKGDFSIRIPVESRDEIGDLGHGFNRMLEQLQIRDRQLEDYRHNLEQQVADRTRELEETVEELRLARDRAEEANRAKSRFLANMSHEIRTPMIGVLGMTELLFNSGLNERQRKLAETVFKSGESLLEILNDLLDLSRIEAGRMELAEEDFDVAEVAEAVVALLRDGAERKGLRFELDLDAEMPTEVRGDSGRFRQILVNLVGNAIKFTEEGRVALRIAPVRDDAGGDRTDSCLYRIEVEDTGIGIPAEMQERIFDSFVQADETMTRQYGGTGLGLAIVRQLVGMMEGEIQLESRPGAGTRFTLMLPFRLQPRPSRVFRLPEEKNRFLLVSDDPAMGSLVGKLEALGADVVVAESGSRALAELRRKQPKDFSLILIDQSMAGLAGARLVDVLARDETLPKRPVIMLCPADDTTMEMPHSDLPDLVWLHVPVRRRQLEETLQSLLGLDEQALAEDDFPSLPPGCRILLVEDNATTRDYVMGLFGGQSDRLQLARDGAEALAYVGNNKVDLILMDVQMPVMDGLEATRRLRAAGFRGPIVALTARGFEEDIRRCLDAGMDAHLCKPFKRCELVEVLNRWLPAGDGTQGGDL